MKMIYPGYWDINIQWTRPILFKKVLLQGFPEIEKLNLCMIKGRYGKSNYKQFCIGQIDNQYLSKRHSQANHKQRYAQLIKKYPRLKIHVNGGKVAFN